MKDVGIKRLLPVISTSISEATRRSLENLSIHAKKKGNKMENIILIGHGSPKKEANNIDLIGELLHSAVHPSCGGSCVKVAYLQFAEPDIMETIRGCIE